MRRRAATPRAVRRAEMIERAADRGGRLAGQLLAFSGKQMLRPKTVSVYQVMSAMHEFLARPPAKRCASDCIPNPDFGLAMLIPGQLELAILNLVMNARDAMPVGGNIPISCRNLTMTAATARGPGRPKAISSRQMSPTPAQGFPLSCWRKCSSLSSPPSRLAKAAAWVLPRYTGLLGSRAAGWICTAYRGTGRRCRCACRGRKAQTVFLRTERARIYRPGTNQTLLVVEPDLDLRTTICEILSQSATGRCRQRTRRGRWPI